MNRLEPVERKGVMGRMVPAATQTDLADLFGGGRFRVSARDADGRIIGNVMVFVDRDVRGDPRVEPERGSPERFGRILQTTRIIARLSVAQLAGKLDVTKRALEKWENGDNLPSLQNFNRIADVLPDVRKAKPKGMIWRAPKVVPLRSLPTPAPSPAEITLADLGEQYANAVRAVSNAKARMDVHGETFRQAGDEWRAKQEAAIDLHERLTAAATKEGAT